MNDLLLKRSKLVLKKVLKKRGYKIGKEIKDVDEFALEFTTNEGKRGKAVWSFEEQEGKKFVTDVFEECLKSPIHLILIYNNMTNFALKMFRDHFKDYFGAELIHINSLQRFLWEHPLVPDYVILSKMEADRVIEAYSPKNRDPLVLPYICTDDPVGVMLNLKVGQIVKEISYLDHSTKKIDRERPPIITYRYVIK